MVQRDQVIAVMERLGGAATLGQLNQKVDISGWGTNTPYATIRRLVQSPKYFFRIKAGLWGLNTHRDQLGHLMGVNQTRKEIDEQNHYYYQGLLLEIGNAKKLETYVPEQDKNKKFLSTTLGQVRKLQNIHPFSYDDTLKRAGRIDVLWFNRRHMPYAAFEVENSTDFTGALSRYIALQDFNVKFYVVADEFRRRQFERKVVLDEYHPIRNRVTFMNYDRLAKWHGHSMAVGHLGAMP